MWGCITLPNFIKIGQSVAEILQFLDFSDRSNSRDMQANVILCNHKLQKSKSNISCLKYTSCLKKPTHLIFHHNWRPIFKPLSITNSQGNSIRMYDRDFRLSSVTLLTCFVICKNSNNQFRCNEVRRNEMSWDQCCPWIHFIDLNPTHQISDSTQPNPLPGELVDKWPNPTQRGPTPIQR